MKARSKVTKAAAAETRGEKRLRLATVAVVKAAWAAAASADRMATGILGAIEAACDAAEGMKVLRETAKR